MKQTLVAGVDSSTQSCKVMIRDAETGALVRSGVARHSTGTEVDPAIWQRAFDEAVRQAGGLDDVRALAIAGQQHGMVPLDEGGDIVRKAILWNDTRSGQDAADLITELGGGDERRGREAWAESVGLVPVASFTITKLRWLRRAEPEQLARTAAVALPHDWLTWRVMSGTSSGDRIPVGGELTDLATDRSDASGTGYFDPVANTYHDELLRLAADRSTADLVLPRVLSPAEPLGTARVHGRELLIGPGCGDNAGAALGLGLASGQVSMSIGTSGVVSLVTDTPTRDPSGLVAGFADASGRHLPLIATLNASRVLDAFAALLGVDHRRFSELALMSPPGAEGLVCVPYLEGERTPNLPDATGALHGVQGSNLTPANVARAAVEGMLCGVGEGIEALRRLGIEVTSVALIGGGTQSEAVRRIAPTVLGLPVVVPERGEYVADGAALQAAWCLTGTAAAPTWRPRMSSEFAGRDQPFIRERFHEVNELVARRGGAPEAVALSPSADVGRRSSS